MLDTEAITKYPKMVEDYTVKQLYMGSKQVLKNMEMPEIHHRIKKIVMLFKRDYKLIANFLKYQFLLNTSEGFETY